MKSTEATSTKADEVIDLFIPGRGRAKKGTALAPNGFQRIKAAAEYYVEHNLAERGGKIIVSGYKTPADHDGDSWPAEKPYFKGIPEAYLGAFCLLDMGIPGESIIIEPFSFDTVTNFTYSYWRFPREKRPIGIVAQNAHLDRMMRYIAPRTLDRPYVGLIAPEADPQHPDSDNIFSVAATRISLLGVTTETPCPDIVTQWRSSAIWRGVEGIQSIVDHGKNIIHSLGSFSASGAMITVPHE